MMRGAIGLVQASGLNIGTAVEAAPAWMIITAPASLKTGDIGIVIRDYKQWNPAKPFINTSIL